jgi:hypothetical protein
MLDLARMTCRGRHMQLSREPSLEHLTVEPIQNQVGMRVPT